MATEELESAPSMRTLYPKAVAGLGRAMLRKLPGLGGGEGGLPDTQLVLADVEVDREHLAAYDRVCEFPLRDTLPATYPHMVSFPLQMQIMTAGDFPFPAMGLVHIENRIDRIRPIGAGETLMVRAWASDLEDHERGRSFLMNAEAEAGGELVWRSVSTYLRREGGGGGGSSDKGRDKVEPPEADAVWKLGGDTGRRYAAVSGDRNPIHLHPLTARLFGMPKPIAHGMWLKARCLAALESVLPGAYSVDVRFKLPVFLPGKVAFASWPVGETRELAVHDAKSGKPHLTGVVSPL